MLPMRNLEYTYFPMSLPYHDNLVQIRQALSAHQLTLQQVWDVLADNQAGIFNSLTPEASLPAPDQSPSPATREQLSITPELYSLLIANPANAATIQKHYGLSSLTDIPGTTEAGRSVYIAHRFVLQSIVGHDGTSGLHDLQCDNQGAVL